MSDSRSGNGRNDEDWLPEWFREQPRPSAPASSPPPSAGSAPKSGAQGRSGSPPSGSGGEDEFIPGWFRQSGASRSQRSETPPPVRESAQVRYAPGAPTEVYASQARGSTAVTEAPPAAPPEKPKKKKKSLIRRIMRVIAIILALLMVYGVSLAWYTTRNINRIEAMPAEQIANTPGAVYLLVGSDSREGAEDLNTGTDIEGQRTDTIMLLHSPLFGAPTLVSLPRDSWVEIPGNGSGKLNSAYAIGGAPLLIETVELNTGLHVDHYVEIGFNGIVDITDAVGGVTLCIDYDVDDEKSGLVMEAGCHESDGETALAFVRMRYSDPTGDIGRIERQQQYVSALVSEIMKPSTLLNPFTMFGIADAVASSLTVDEKTGIFNMARMGVAFIMVTTERGEQATIPIADPDYWVNGQSAILWDEQGADDLFAEMGARN